MPGFVARRIFLSAEIEKETDASPPKHSHTFCTRTQHNPVFSDFAVLVTLHLPHLMTIFYLHILRVKGFRVDIDEPSFEEKWLWSREHKIDQVTVS
jgi:hypothetical protein